MKHILISWRPTGRGKLYLHIDGEHARWTPFHPDCQMMPDGKTRIKYKGTKFTLHAALALVKKFTGRLETEHVDDEGLSYA